MEGQDIQPENKHEKQIFDLVSMIEAEYDREKHPEVFSSIINIHQGQCKSIIQQDDSPDSKSSDILKISIEKGSASVLADAYLVCGDVDIALFDLMFGFGFVLQLIDDLQDAVEDYENSHKTLFSQKVYSEKLDNLTSKLISFTMNSLDFDSCKKSKYIAEIKKLIVDNTLRLVFKAVWDNRKLYSRRYIRQFKRFTPYDYNYIRKKTDKLKLEFKKLDGLI